MNNNINQSPDNGQGYDSPDNGQGTNAPDNNGQGQWAGKTDDSMFDFEGQGILDNPAPTDGQGDGEQEYVDQELDKGEQPTSNWAEKFETPEEMYAHYQKLEKSYNNLRPKLTKTAMELSALKRNPTQQKIDQYQQYPQSQQYQYQQPQPQYYRNQQTGQVYQQPYQNPYAGIDEYVQQAIQPIREQQEDLKLQNEIARIAVNPDFEALSPEIVKVFQSTPQLWNVPNALETAYHIARSKIGTKELSRAVSNARQEAYKNREIKEINGSDRTRKANTQQKSTEEQLADDILSGANRGSSLFR